MKTKKLAALLAFAFITGTSAHAGVQPLQGAIVNGTYNGAASGLLGADNGYQPGTNANVTAVTNSDIEYLTSDFFFAADFTTDGLLTITANDIAIPTGSYKLNFDFGTSLAKAIGSFTLGDHSAIGGLPLLSIVNSHTISVDLSNVNWRGDYTSFSAQLLSAAAVPEPGSASIVLAGLAGMAALRRRRAPRA